MTDEQMPAKTLTEQDFDHPCRGTCSGWQQGYERGHRAGRAEAFEEAANIAWEHERKRFAGETIGSTAIGNAIQTRAEQERKGENG